MDFGAARSGVAEQQVVEIGARNLPGLRSPYPGCDAKVGIAFGLPIAAHERRSPFFREARLTDEVIGADGAQHIVHRCEQRFADVKSREAVALEQLHRVTGARQPRGRRRTSRATSGDDYVAIERSGSRHARTVCHQRPCNRIVPFMSGIPPMFVHIAPPLKPRPPAWVLEQCGRDRRVFSPQRSHQPGSGIIGFAVGRWGEHALSVVVV